MQWIGTWGCAQYYGDDTGDEGRASALRISQTLKNATLRQIIRTSTGGSKLRLTLSNEYGETPLVIQEAHIAKAAVLRESTIDIATDTAVTFNGGNKNIVIPPGRRAVSDAINYHTEPLERIAVSICFSEVPERVSCHVGARAKSFIQPGNAVSAEILGSAETNTHWFVLTNADVLTENPDAGTIVCFGDSITDGYGVAEEAYTRWTDVFTEKLLANPQTRNIGIVNMGIGGNHLLVDENPAAGIRRFKRDVLNQTGIGYLMFLIGVNDLAFGNVTAEEMIAAYDHMIKAATAENIKVYTCTILPYSNEDPRRHTINNWLRSLKKDHSEPSPTIDFDELMRDPENPDRMLPKYDNDGIHPSLDGYAAMGEYAYGIFTS